MTWTSFHNRGEILRNVIDVANARLDGRLPTDVDGVGATFDDELDLLCTLQLKWHTRLAGRIERELMAQPLDLESAVVHAWHGVADELPGVRAILDAYRAEPVDAEMAHAISKSRAKEHMLLAVMAGHASVADERAVPVGERIEERARASYVPVPPELGAGRPSLLDRIRAVLAA
ncbi:hypothetical protein [Nocardioides sp. CER19]|uniref:hypothetical protein n=1 Tax=Nocardioides sp. CER19 TaxID=3038538 RepID=UPI00244751FD|nr:hypothetical protein [Nocardioides sp. CER19]MDH2413992.1 hypothetical protein [Nocardioides sp. CER19]